MKLALLFLVAVPLARADLTITPVGSPPGQPATIIDNDNGLRIESLTSFVQVHADANEVELEGGEIHLHSPGEIHIEGEPLGGFVHIEATGTGQVLVNSVDGNITLESFANNIFVHADAGEVEVEGAEVHAHSPGEVHIEGEGALGGVLIETTGGGDVTIRTTGTGAINIGNGLQRGACSFVPAPPAPCAVTAVCPGNQFAAGFSLSGCAPGTLRVTCCPYAF